VKHTLTITPNAAGKDIELIKELRDLTGKGLKECYELVTNRKPFTVEVEDHKDNSPFRRRQPEYFLRVAALLEVAVTIDPPLPGQVAASARLKGRDLRPARENLARCKVAAPTSVRPPHLRP
jgi:hypothetical protein